MSRGRLGSLLALLWSAIQARTLVYLRFYPPRHVVGWGLCAIFLAISVGLWLGKPWARMSFLAIGCLFVLVYAGLYLFANVPCWKDLPGCHPLWIASQPLLTIVALVVLWKPLASNNRWRAP